MKKCLLFGLLMLSVTAFTQTYNVDFDQVSWTLNGNGTSVSGNELTIIGNSNSYQTATYTLTVDPNIDDLYFTAKIYLDNIIGGSNDWDLPKIRMDRVGGGKLINYNISTSVEGQWVHTGVSIENFKNLGLSQVVLTVGLQNASGTMKVKEALVSSQQAVGNYIFPYTVPGDPSVTLDVNTSNSHKFNNDLLSTNCHFTWAPYTWEDNNVKEMIYEKFPMQNLRFPGGTVANFYNWQTDDFYANAYSLNNNTANTGSQNAARFGYPGYLDVTKTLGGSSTLLFNVFSDDKATSQARLQSRLDDGLDIKWVEMGNENYFSDQAYGFVDDRETGINGNNDGNFYDEYIKHTKELAGWLREIKPDIQVLVNTHDNHWNNPLAAENYYDGCVMHNYIFNNSFMMNQFAATEYMAAYRTTQNRLDGFVNTFGNKPVIMSEWGLLSEMPNYFLQVICSADNFLSIEKGNERGIVEQAGIHMLYHGNFIGEGSMIMHNGTELTLNPIGVMYSKLYDVFLHHDVYDAYSVSAELETGVDGVYAKAIDLGDSVYVFAVNKLPVSSPLHLSFDGVNYNGAFSMESYTEDMSTKLTRSYSLTENPWTKSSGSGAISFPANSISVVTIQKAAFQAVCDAPNLGENTNLCGQATVVLQANVSTTNRTFTWYKNDAAIGSENGASLTVSTPGNYKVVADSAGCLRSHEVYVGDELPTIYLGPDLNFCTTIEKVLDANSNNPSTSYHWTKNGVSMSATSPTLTTSAEGVYEVTVSAGSCLDVTDEISITSDLVDVEFDTICAPGMASLLINDNGDFAWYDAPTNGLELSTALFYEPVIANSSTFYVQDNNVQNYSLGRSAQAGTVFGGSTDYSIWGRTMYMNVEKGFTLESFDIFTNSTVDIVVHINGTGGNFTFTENGIPNTGKTNAYTLNPNMFIPEGQYTIDLLTTNGKVFVQVSDRDNADLAGVVSFGGTDGGNHYGYFYNWNISIASSCARTPVEAVIDPNGEGCIITSSESDSDVGRVDIYPNPTEGLVKWGHIAEFRLYTSKGLLVTEGINSSVDVSSLEKGVYIIEVDGKRVRVLKL